MGESTGQGKSKRVLDVLAMHSFDPDWTLPSRLANNPMVWTVSINGFALDARALERDQAALRHAAGLIPFVHADQETGVVSPGENASQ